MGPVVTEGDSGKQGRTLVLGEYAWMGWGSLVSYIGDLTASGPAWSLLHSKDSQQQLKAALHSLRPLNDSFCLPL